jgi:hypothetical protein
MPIAATDLSEVNGYVLKKYNKFLKILLDKSKGIFCFREIFRVVYQLVRLPALGAGGSRFESGLPYLK